MTKDAVGEGDAVDKSAVEPGQPAPADAPATPTPTGGLSRKKTIIGAIVAIVFLAIVFVRVIPQIGDYSEAADYVKSMSVGAIIGLICVTIFYLFVYGWPFVASTPGLRYKSGFIVNQSAFAVSNGIPAGGAFGLGLQYAQLASYKITPTAATASISATGIWSVFITLFLPVTGVVALTLSGDNAAKYVNAAIIGIVVLIVVIGLFALILRSENNARRVGGLADKFVNWLLRLFRRHNTVDLTAATLKLRHDVVGLVTKRWHVITIAQIGVSWSQFAILYAAMVGISGGNGTLPVLAAYGCWAVSQLGIMIPVTPGGLGTVDAVLIGLLVSVGMDSGAATAADLVWRASSYIPQIIIGLISIFYWRWDVRHRPEKHTPVAG